MHKSNEDELTKTIENFIKKSVSIIINSRIANSNIDSTNKQFSDKSNSKERIELEEIFSDEYDELQSSHQDMKTYTLDIYFKRREAKILIEKWRFKYNCKKTNNKMMDNFVFKKMSSLIRSVYTITRILPGFTFSSKKGFNFSLDFKIYTRMSNQENFMIPFKSLKLDNLNIVSGIEVTVDYILKQEIFKLENDHKKIEKDNKIFTRPRFLSEDNSNLKYKIPSFEIFNFEDTSINDDYFSKITEKSNPNPNSNTICHPSRTDHKTSINKSNFSLYRNNQREKRLHSLDEENSDNISHISRKDSYIKDKLLSNNILEHSSILDSLSSTSQSKTQLEKIQLNNFNSSIHLLDSLNLVSNFKKLENNYYKDLKTSDTSSDQSSSSESFELEIEYIDNCENCENCSIHFEGNCSNLNLADTCKHNEIDLNADNSVCEIRNKIHASFVLEDVIKKFDKMRKKTKFNPQINYINFFRIYHSNLSVKDLFKKINSND